MSFSLNGILPVTVEIYVNSFYFCPITTIYPSHRVHYPNRGPTRWRVQTTDFSQRVEVFTANKMQTTFGHDTVHLPTEPAAYILEMEVSVLYEKLVTSYKTTRCHSPDDHNLNTKFFFMFLTMVCNGNNYYLGYYPLFRALQKKFENWFGFHRHHWSSVWA